MTFNQAQINAEIDTQLPNNNTNQIAPATMRGVLHDMTSYTSQSVPAITPELFGATNPTADAWPAFQQAIPAALSLGVPIALSGRVYLTSQTLDFQTLFVQGTNDSIIRALTPNMLVVRNGNLNTVEIDGDNKALWGWLTTSASNTGQSPSSVRGYNVLIDKNTEYGFVSDSIQNATFIGMFCQNNLIANMVFANGSANCKLFNCTINSNAGVTPNACNLLLLYDTSNPHGFGLSTSPGQFGNRHLTFFGGIMERVFVENIRTLNPAGWPTPGGEVNFYDYEFDSPSVATFDATYDGTLNFFNCGIGGDGSGAALINGAGNGANVYFWNYSHGECPGGYNSAGIDFGMICNNNLSKLLNFSLANFANNPPYGTHGAILTDSYTASTRTINLTCTAGQGHVDLPQDNANAIGWRGFSMDRLPLVRICFSLSGFVGGTTVDLVASGSGTTIAAGNTAGAHEVVYRGQASDSGVFQWFSGAGVTAWQLSNVSIEYL